MTTRPLLAGMSLALLIAVPAADAAPPQLPPAKPAPGSVQRENNMKEALATPLEDVNIRRVEIPEVLKRSVYNPYDLRNITSCAAIAAEIKRIDDAIGQDFDAPEVQVERSRLEQAKGGAATVTRVGAQMLMPFRGVVRQLSGANAYQREVNEAIEAGSARRGFLKGTGMRLNCSAPAAPYGFRPVAAPRPPVVRPAPQPTRRR